ncbi:hypothetical protein SAMN05720470_10853 [Fibrobacter sp. UWOV1]|uniref:hypothetical protein n=1 Tax=Fibrobacter sp. UWOV1 TaxID=1896215 RepID=UPI0009240A30|nr:hypothetical protein [Fibrobacter sp. UWOV1]SHL42705.1 hypothetical protein SAMN05720470_10853 [Fibrobacter sp. UWOV1]
MNERSLDRENNDIYYDSVNRCVARTVGFADSTAQKIKSYLQTFVGECFTAREAGVEWYDKVLGVDVLAVDAAKAEIREKIMLVSGVKSVKDISVRVDGRNTKFEYTVVLEDGSVIEDEINGRV